MQQTLPKISRSIAPWIHRTDYFQREFSWLIVKLWLMTLRKSLGLTAKRLIFLIILKVAGRFTTIHVFRYGRLGNNVQQILMAKLHVMRYGCKVTLCPGLKNSLEIAGGSDDFFLHQKAFEISLKDQSRPCRPQLFTLNAGLFFYRDLQWWQLNTFVRPNEFEGAICSIIKPLKDSLCIRNSVLVEEYERKNVCLLHLRGGDISDLHSPQYITNPLSYYVWLSEQSCKFMVVMQPSCRHPLFNEICDLLRPESILSHSAVDKDFYALTSCPKIATSGVGTFAIAAALLNKNLKELFFSNAFCEEHLNPLLVESSVLKKCYKMPNDFFVQWSMSTPTERLLLLKK